METQVQVCSNSNQENKSLPRKWNKCIKHPNYDEECYCRNCNMYVCCKCGLLEHAKDAHTILEAGAHETEQKNQVEKLASKADAKIRNVDKYFTFIEDQRKRLHNAQEQLNCEIDATFEELVEKLKERKTMLKNEVEHKLGKLKTLFGDVAKPIRKQIDEIKKVLDLVKNGLNFPLQTEALNSHKAMCQQLEELLNQIRPDEELPRRTAEEGERIGFRSQGSEGLKLGQLRQKNSKSWILRTEAPLPYGKNMNGMAISPHNEMASVSSTRLRSEFVEKTLQVLDHFQSPVFRIFRKDGDWAYPAVCQDDSVIIAWVKHHPGLVQVINDMSGAIIHSISKDGYNLYPAVCQDDSVIIAWVKLDQHVQHDQGLVSIV
eukprot:XP_011669265.1 PREDICTED: uncharacterized protein LOC105440610 [Strongylocentrotus purpuratus]